jgi:hypothetical protein
MGLMCIITWVDDAAETATKGPTMKYGWHSTPTNTL